MTQAPDLTPELAALRARYPQLVARGEGKKMSSTALAAKNLRILLKEQYPDRRFFVRSDLYAGGSSIYVEFHDTDGNGRELARAVDALGSKFEYGKFDGMTDSYEYHGGEHRQFTDLFGAASHVLCQVRPMSEQDLADLREKKLERSLPKARSRGPGKARM